MFSLMRSTRAVDCVEGDVERWTALSEQRQGRGDVLASRCPMSKTNGYAQVLGRADKPIAASMGWCGHGPRHGWLLLSGGINLGPAMTFGYIAGRHAAGSMERAVRSPSLMGPTAERQLSVFWYQ
jgi:hypothetical protein